MDKEDFYYLGKITKKHGFKGNLIIHLETDDREFYKNMESVFIEKDGIPVPFFIESIKPHGKDKYLIKFEDISPEDAERLVNRPLYLPLDSLPELEGTDFYYHDIIGYTVIDTQKGEIGIINNVNDSGIQHLFEILNGKKEILIPVVDEWILEVNREEKFIKLETPEGLIDLYL